ncbi:MAG: radical SAM protein [Anaerovoracaceae bacterium]|jgi:hypothetical protein
MKYKLNNQELDSVELKCLVVSQGLKVGREVYKRGRKDWAMSPNALCCDSFLLPDDTVVMATDLGMHLSTVSSMFSWDNIKLLKYMNSMKTDFSLEIRDRQPVLCYKKEVVTPVKMLPHTDFYDQRCKSGTPFMGNSVLLGDDWVAFQCLWPCDFARAGKPCQFCYSGGQYAALARRNKPMPKVPSPADVAEIINWTINRNEANSIQITGGSTFDPVVEERYITAYLDAINADVGRQRISGEIVLYITPPSDHSVIDRYFDLGVDSITCSIEVWDDALAEEITPGKRLFTTKERHLDALEYIAGKYGPNKAFCNFIIGLEPLESLAAGVNFMASRGIVPNASVWMPMGKPVRGTMTPPGLDFFRACKGLFAEAYYKYDLIPAGLCGVNTCVERDIWRYIHPEK